MRHSFKYVTFFFFFDEDFLFETQQAVLKHSQSSQMSKYLARKIDLNFINKIYSAYILTAILEDHCASQPCYHLGTCMNTNDGYQCRCLHDYSGYNCEIGKGCM